MAQRTLTRTELILQQQAQAHFSFRVQVIVWWFVILGVLIFLFSGTSLELGPLAIKTIELDTEFITEWAPFISWGVPRTIGISVAAIFFAIILALLSALGQLSRIPPLVAISSFYVSLIRGTPLLLQIFFFFFALPQIGIKLSGPVAGIVALSLNYGAYMSEIFRAGIESISKGQQEAAVALGMTQRQMMRRIILPQALRLVVPPTGNEFIAMLKDSALVSTTGFVQEILWRSQKAGRQNFRMLEALVVAALWYWLVTILFTMVQSRIERYAARGER
jgi:polar amino acid transport system permease protein